jgi:hypothetical protein
MQTLECPPKKQDVIKSKKLSIQTILTFVFAALAFVMLLFSPFGFIDSSVIPFHPIGWAGIFIYFAMLCFYSQKYHETKDVFWLILALIFFPNFISDLYFFPIPKIFGFGMFEWMGVQMFVSLLCFAIYSRVKILRYSNLLLLGLFPVATVAYLFPQFNSSLSSAIIVVSCLSYIVVMGSSLLYYAFLRKEYLILLGAVLNFLIANVISGLFTGTGILLFGWSQPFMAVVTDRMAIFGRILMVIDIAIIISVLTRFSMKKKKQQVSSKYHSKQ